MVVTMKTDVTCRTAETAMTALIVSAGIGPREVATNANMTHDPHSVLVEDKTAAQFAAIPLTVNGDTPTSPATSDLVGGASPKDRAIAKSFKTAGAVPAVHWQHTH